MPDAPQSIDQPSSHDVRPSTAVDTALEIARLQARLSELQAARPATLNQPVTFWCMGAGAHRARGNESTILFCFPVHHGRHVWIAAEYATAAGFAERLVATLGGWDAVRARGLKRGNRR